MGYNFDTDIVIETCAFMGDAKSTFGRLARIIPIRLSVANPNAEWWLNDVAVRSLSLDMPYDRTRVQRMKIQLVSVKSSVDLMGAAVHNGNLHFHMAHGARAAISLRGISVEVRREESNSMHIDPGWFDTVERVTLTAQMGIMQCFDPTISYPELEGAEGYTGA